MTSYHLKAILRRINRFSAAAVLVLDFSGPDIMAAEPVIAKSLTFEQAREITWQNSHLLKAAGYSALQKKEESRAAKSLYFPTIGVSASAVMMSDPIHLDMTPLKDAITPLYNTLGTYGKFGGIPGVPDDVATQIIRQKLLTGESQIEAQNWDQMIQEKNFAFLAATFQWPVYAGGKIRAANRAAAINQSESQKEIRQKQGELMSELVERYFGLTLARQVVSIREDVLEGIAKHLQDAEKFEREGMVSHVDVLHARVYFAQAQRELSKARQQEEIAEKALTSTLAVGDSVEIVTISDLFYLDTIEPESYFTKVASQNNPLLDQLESKKELVKQAYRAERAELLPAIAIQGAYDIVNKDLSDYAPDWEVGVGLKWTLFDGVSRISKMKAVKLQGRELDEYDQKVSSDLETLVSKLHHETQMYREQLQSLDTAQRFAVEYLRARETEFREETTGSTDVIDARLALAQVRIERLQAIYNYDESLARLLEYAGIPADFSSYATRTGVKTEHYN